jgi:hypothetical protein
MEPSLCLKKRPDLMTGLLTIVPMTDQQNRKCPAVDMALRI